MTLFRSPTASTFMSQRSIRSCLSRYNEDLPPAVRLRELLRRPLTEEDAADDVDADGFRNFPKLFVQMDELQSVSAPGEMGDVEWREVARWVKFEETVEHHGERWSKPHVSTVPLHAVLELRRGLQEGAVLVDVQANNLVGITELILRDLIERHLVSDAERDMVYGALLKPHRHQFLWRQNNKKQCDTLFAPKRQQGHTPHWTELTKRNPFLRVSFDDLDDAEKGDTGKKNKQFLKKVPGGYGAEAANILIGEVDLLSQPVLAFVRLKDPVSLGTLTEIPLKTRFLFVLLGPTQQAYPNQYYEIGRCLATLLCDEVFHLVAFCARGVDDLVAGLDEFLDSVTLLPPSNWDPAMRIEPPPKLPSSRLKSRFKLRRVPTQEGVMDGYDESGDEDDGGSGEDDHDDPALHRTGRLFGGMVADIKRRLPWYWSDFRDALSLQCISSFIFLYFAAMTPIVTFGGLLGIGTENYMASMECLLAGAICGIVFHLFSGQPLNVLGPTGPMLVLEVIVHHFAHDHGFNYLAFRVWIGLWTTVLLLIIVAFDLSALVRYITRFTEEAFACLISTIFVYDAISKLLHTLDNNPINTHPHDSLTYECSCFPPNTTSSNATTQNLTLAGASGDPGPAYNLLTEATTATATLMSTSPDWFSNDSHWEALGTAECRKYGGTTVGPGCDTPHYVADVFFVSLLLFLFTFGTATCLHRFRGSSFFPTRVRSVASDFAVFIAIILATGLDWAINIDTPKLHAPEEFHPTRQEDRGWFINPLENVPWWLTLASILPAILATILIFMDQQITAVIINRKDNKLRKGVGYHLDLFVLAILVAVCSLLGLPWYVASTVVAITHVTSLKEESECTAPGEVPQFVRVREQRVTGICAHLMIGLSVFFTPLLKHVPMPVLYGVFLYMGVSSLKGLQLVDRILILFMPSKYQPDYAYLREVPPRRVHLFTAIQVLCLAGLWVVKKIKKISIAFPLMVLALCVVRQLVLERLFTREELAILDNVLPAKRKDKNKSAKIQTEISHREKEMVELRTECYDTPETYRRKHAKGLNLSEEVAKTGIWRQLMTPKPTNGSLGHTPLGGNSPNNKAKFSNPGDEITGKNGTIPGGDVNMNTPNTPDSPISPMDEDAPLLKPTEPNKPHVE